MVIAAQAPGTLLVSLLLGHTDLHQGKIALSLHGGPLGHIDPSAGPYRSPGGVRNGHGPFQHMVEA